MTRALVCGYRGGLVRALERMGVAYSIWHDRAVVRNGKAEAIHVEPFPARIDRVAGCLARGGLGTQFSHVLAGTEGAVVAASLARRVCDARRAPHAVSLRCHDKLFMKRAVQALGIPMTPFLDGEQALRDPEALHGLGSPVVVKDRDLSGGRGLEIVSNPPQQDVRVAGRLVERFVDAPECSVETYVHRRRVAFQNVTEYLTKRHVNVVPAGLPQAELEALTGLTRRVHEGLQIRWGLTHTEWYRAPRGALFGEIALRPPGGYIMDLIQTAYGFDTWQAFVAMELDLDWEFPLEPKQHTAATILHPGAGRVTAVHGLQAVLGMPEVLRARVRVGPGDELAKRYGSGTEAGHVLLRAGTRERLDAALTEIGSTLRIEMI